MNKHYDVIMELVHVAVDRKWAYIFSFVLGAIIAIAFYLQGYGLKEFYSHVKWGEYANFSFSILAAFSFLSILILKADNHFRYLEYPIRKELFSIVRKLSDIYVGIVSSIISFYLLFLFYEYDLNSLFDMTILISTTVAMLSFVVLIIDWFVSFVEDGYWVA